MIILNGTKAAQEEGQVLKEKIKSFDKKPIFSIVQVGNLFSSNKYIGNKINKAQELGIIARLIKVPNSIEQNELISLIKKEAKISNGLIVQLPLPEKLDKDIILNAVPLDKDIDGLSNENSNLLYSGKKCIKPATARGIIDLIKKYEFDIENKNIGIIGESNLVGKPLKELFKREGAKSIVSYNIKTGIKGSENADILVVAAGSSNLVKKENVKSNSIVIDVGINSIGEKDKIQITGDVDFENVKNKVMAISPVPGGVGPMTVISLFKNLIENMNS